LGENQTGNQFLFYFKSDGFSHENSNLIFKVWEGVAIRFKVWGSTFAKGDHKNIKPIGFLALFNCGF
jgi:hypothetical protein